MHPRSFPLTFRPFFPRLLTLALLVGFLPAGSLSAREPPDSLATPTALLVCDSSADRVVVLQDVDGSGSIEAGAPGEINVFYDDSSPGPDLSTPSHLAPGPGSTVYLLDGGALDQVLALTDLDADGDANDPGEVTVFYDNSTPDGPRLYTPNSLVAAPDGAYYVSDDGSRAHRILRLRDDNGDGDALDPLEAEVVYDTSGASAVGLEDIESLAVSAGGLLYAGDASLQKVFILQDLDGDGLFLSEGEADAFFSGGNGLSVGDVESLVAFDGQVFTCDRQTGLLLSLLDANGDGDADDAGEAWTFLDSTVPWGPSNVTDMTVLAGGDLLILDNKRDTVVLAQDLNGNGNVLDDGEVLQWIFDEGKTLALPQGVLAITLQAAEPPQDMSFIRGDTTGDGKLDISDAIALLGFLFLGGAVQNCEDSLDCDDSGIVNISDPIYSLNFLFLGKEPPPAPYPDAGADTTPDSLDCRPHDDGF